MSVNCSKAVDRQQQNSDFHAVSDFVELCHYPPRLNDDDFKHRSDLRPSAVTE